MRTGTPIGKNNVALCIERIFAEEPRQVDHKYAILRNQQHTATLTGINYNTPVEIS